MTALAIREDQTNFDGNQIAVLRAAGVDEDVSEAELAAFLHVCQRRALDPFTKQIYLIGRWDRNKGRKVYTHQTSIDGFRLIARRAADRSGIDYAYEDTIWYGDDGKTFEAWLWNTPPAAAKVVVVRNGNRYDAVARFGAYVQTDRNGNPSGQWRTMPDVMIAKCAEALALRKAFPEDLGGLYTFDEMAQADNDTASQPPTVQAKAERVERPSNGQRKSAAPETDEKWLKDVLERIRTIASRDDGNKLWAEINAKRDAGQCTPDDVKELRQMIAMQVEIAEAHAAEEAAQELPADTLQGQVIAPHQKDAA